MTKFTVTTPTEAGVSVTSDLMQVSDNGILFFYNTSDRNGGKQIVRAFASGHWNSVERNSPVVVR